MLSDQSTAFNAWATWANDTSGDADLQWFADQYSGWGLKFTYINSSTGPYSFGGNQFWYDWQSDLDENGWCMRDMMLGLGGFCIFPR